MELPRRLDVDDPDGNRSALPYGSPRRTWAGRGTGGPCDYCSKTIRPEQVEYEVECLQDNAPRVLHLHFACYQEWIVLAKRARP